MPSSDHSDRAVGDANSQLYDLLWSHIEEEDWTPATLRQQLPQWQADYLLASMHAGTCENGGDFHGLYVSTRGNELEALAESWERIGAVRTASAIRRAGTFARTLGWNPTEMDLDDLSPSKQAELEAYYATLTQESSDEWEVLLFTYYSRCLLEQPRDDAEQDASPNRFDVEASDLPLKSDEP